MPTVTYRGDANEGRAKPGVPRGSAGPARASPGFGLRHRAGLLLLQAAPGEGDVGPARREPPMVMLRDGFGGAEQIATAPSKSGRERKRGERRARATRA